jgi:hypothetical protein
VTVNCYLYAVVEPSHPRNFGAIGLDDAVVLVASDHGLGAAFSEIGGDSVTPTKAHLLSHERVLEQLLADSDTVLPFSFGTLARDKDAVLDLLKVAEAEFKENIARLRGCVEVGLKVFWQKEAMRREVEQITGSIANIGKRAQGVESRQSSAIQVGQAVEQVVRHWREHYVPIITATLEPVCRDWKENNAFGATMLWNGAFLIRRENQTSFLDKLTDLDRRLGNRLDFRHVAPLPPYNFVQLRYGVEGISG